MSDRPKVHLSAKERRDLREDFLLCRTLGHQWDDFNPIGMRRPLFGVRLSVRCVRCAMERHDLINANGEVGQRSYVVPDGYAIPGGTKRPELRVELVRRRRKAPLKAAGR